MRLWQKTNTYLRWCGRLVVILLTVHVYEVDLVRSTGVQVDRLAEIGWRRGTRLFLETLRACSELRIVHANFAGRGKLDRTRGIIETISRCASPVERAGCAIETKLPSFATENMRRTSLAKVGTQLTLSNAIWQCGRWSR